ncbi:MAG: N-6 DNA methylase [Bacteroidales bacterium]|nr:N-6 DNA methylase [Bacteroidales bacterium]
MNESLIYQAHYTKSDPILNYMIGMLNIHSHDTILEPCGGDGVFVDKILEKVPNTRINVFELNPTAVLELKDKYKTINNVHIKETDTLLDETIISCSTKYNIIIGNPPYGARNSDKKKELLNRLYANLYTKESYTLFLYACTRCLNEDGELSFIIPDTFLSLHRHLAIRKYLLTNTKIKELALFPSSFFPGINFGYANLCIITLKKSSNVVQNLRNEILIRTNFKTVDELGNDSCGTKKKITQKEVIEGVGSVFIFNSTDKIAELINDDSILKIGDIASCVTGFYSGNDKDYLHPISTETKNAKKYVCANTENIHTSSLTDKEKDCGIATTDCLVPVVKGGNIEYVKPNSWFMDWSTKAILEYKSSKKCRFQNSNYYFKNGIGIPMIRSSKLTGALIEGRLFDQSIVGVFPKDEKWILYLLGFFNSAVCSELINAINPSTNNSANYIKKIPFIMPNDETKNLVDVLVGEIVSRLKVGNEQIKTQKAKLDEVFVSLYLNRSGMNQNTPQKVIPKQLNFLNLFDQYEREPITQNFMVREDIEVEYSTKCIHRKLPIDLTRNLLVCNVKNDNLEQYLDGSAKIYYTGKKFPTTVALNKLYYFMPYLYGKGIRDLYYIKIARLGYRKEGQANEDKNDLRLVFEIERVGQLFDNYKKIKLEIWRTFTDTTMEKIMENFCID